MSQYGYIPMGKSHRLELNYSLAMPSSWQFQKGEVIYGGLEESQFSDAQKAEIVALGGTWFEDADSFTDWLNS